MGYHWHTIDTARDEWADAPDEDEQLGELLDLAREAVEAYAPAIIRTQAPTAPVADVAFLTALAQEPESIMSVTLSTGTNSAPVTWPNGTPGVFTVLARDAATMAVNSYTVTYGIPAQITFLQPTVTRGTGGVLVTRPDLIVTGSIPIEAPADTEAIPAAYRTAQLMQARNVWNAATVDGSGTMGEGEFIITPRPLDWVIRQLLRPKRGRPVLA